MSEEPVACFAASTPQWWSIAAKWLSWRPDEFWQATPSELRGALSDPGPQGSGLGGGLGGGQAPSIELINEMLERESNG